MPPNAKYRAVAAFAVCAISVLNSGCVGVRSFPTLEPVAYKPSLIAPQEPVLVESLTPTFKWSQTDPEAKADFILWSIGPDEPGKLGAYYIKGISGCQYHISEPLVPGTEYCWSVRISGTLEWANMKYSRAVVVPTPSFVFGSFSVQGGIPFKIKTPLLSPAGQQPSE
jgi:hypothetical protein